MTCNRLGCTNEATGVIGVQLRSPVKIVLTRILLGLQLCDEHFTEQAKAPLDLLKREDLKLFAKVAVRPGLVVDFDATTLTHVPFSDPDYLRMTSAKQ